MISPLPQGGLSLASPPSLSRRFSAVQPKATAAPGRSLLARITSPLGIITIIAMVPLVFALRALHTGYDSLEPV